MLRMLEVFVVLTVIVACIEGRPQSSLNEVAEIFEEIRGNLGEHGKIELIEVVPAILVYETDVGTGGTGALGGGIENAPVSPAISTHAKDSLLGASG